MKITDINNYQIIYFYISSIQKIIDLIIKYEDVDCNNKKINELVDNAKKYNLLHTDNKNYELIQKIFFDFFDNIKNIQKTENEKNKN